MLKYWDTVSKRFANNQYVVGYDLLNEPPAGDVWRNTTNYINTTKTEKEVLQPFY